MQRPSAIGKELDSPRGQPVLNQPKRPEDPEARFSIPPPQDIMVRRPLVCAIIMMRPFKAIGLFWSFGTGGSCFILPRQESLGGAS
jgi:hypothetical protein